MVALALIAGAPAASAGELAPPPSEPPGASDDADCATRPSTYPADGDPVPTTAGCVLISDAAGTAVGESWSWRDAEGARWYNYAAAALPDAPEGRVMMCGSTDSAVGGAPFTCTPDSTYLLFTVDGVFVDWPAAPSADLHFCQRITFGAGEGAVSGAACSTVTSNTSGAVAGEPVEPDAEPTSPAPEESVAPTAPEPVPSDPADPADGGEDAEDAGDGAASQPTTRDDPTASGTDASPGGAAGADQGAAGTSGSGDAAGPSTGDPAAADPSVDGNNATPIASETIARVGGAGFPVGFVLALAVALALAGYVMLAGPGFVAARRTRR